MVAVSLEALAQLGFRRIEGIDRAVPAGLTLHTQLHKLNCHLCKLKIRPSALIVPYSFQRIPAERPEWQKANRSWWEQSPMRYDWRESIGATPQSREFFEEIDKRFFTDSRVYMPYQRLPFEALIDFDNLSIGMSSRSEWVVAALPGSSLNTLAHSSGLT